MTLNLNSEYRKALDVIRRQTDIQESHFTFLSQLYNKSSPANLESTKKIFEELNERLNDRLKGNINKFE